MFEERLEHDLGLAQRRKSALTLAYVDLDNFKAINDARGHGEGDRLLQALARGLRASIRQTDTAARLGGDEFALILPDTDGQGARQLISKLADALPDAVGPSTWGSTCSIGVVTFADAAVSPERAIAVADGLMYEVKRQGKGAAAFRVLGEGIQPRAADNPDAGRR